MKCALKERVLTFYLLRKAVPASRWATNLTHPLVRKHT
ncbi:hypothetical protein P835_00015 [Citrobacter portucalensis]|nr:hypothetical protein P835_00015 [Citrobacter portucalensis]